MWIIPLAIQLGYSDPMRAVAMQSRGRCKASLEVVGQSEFYRVSPGSRTGLKRPNVVCAHGPPY